MRIVVCPSDRQGVGWWRLGLPAMTLMDQGEPIDFEFLPGLPFNQKDGTPHSIMAGFDADIVILQRPMAEWQPLAIRILQRSGVKVIVELDDDVQAVSRRTTFGRAVTQQQLRSLVQCCEQADLITTTTQAIAKRYATHGRYRVLPNYMPKAWLDIKEPQDGNVVGWTGTVASHIDDLQTTHGGVAQAITETGARFRTIGRPQRVQANLNLPNPPEHTPWQSMGNYPHEIAKLDIGICPLADTQFNRAKSWLKPLEMATLGVVPVMSTLPEYVRLHQYGIGLLARSLASDWRTHLTSLLTDPTRRAEQAEQGRQAVREHLTIEDNAWRYAEAWESTLQRPVAA